MRRSLMSIADLCFFFSLSIAFVLCFGCDACCSPPGFYSHFA